MRKEITRESLRGYVAVLQLPSFSAYEHPTTFHTVVVRRSTKKVNLSVIAEGIMPGLESDPDIRIPAGMFREIVRKIARPGVEVPMVPLPVPIRHPALGRFGRHAEGNLIPTQPPPAPPNLEQLRFYQNNELVTGVVHTTTALAHALGEVPINLDPEPAPPTPRENMIDWLNQPTRRWTLDEEGPYQEEED